MDRIRKVLVTSSLSIGAVTGAFLGASALSGQSSGDRGMDADVGLVEQASTLSTIMPATSGNEAPIFSSSVSAAQSAKAGSIALADGVVKVSLSRTPDKPEICFEIAIGDGTSTGCADDSLIRTGLAYSATQDHDGPIHVVGIVPDEIDAVLIDGKTIKVSNNVWHYAAPSGTNLSFVVRSVDGRTAAVGKL